MLKEYFREPTVALSLESYREIGVAPRGRPSPAEEGNKRK